MEEKISTDGKDSKDKTHYRERKKIERIDAGLLYESPTDGVTLVQHLTKITRIDKL